MTTVSTIQATELNIRINKGTTLDTNNSTFSVVDDAGDDIDLSGYTSGTLVLKKRSYSSAASMTFSTADSSLVLGNGSFSLAKSATDMDALDDWAYEYILIVVDDSDNEYPVAKGIATIEA